MKMSVRAERDSCNTEVRWSGRASTRLRTPPVAYWCVVCTGVVVLRWCRTQEVPGTPVRRTRKQDGPWYIEAKMALVKILTYGRGRASQAEPGRHPSARRSVTPVCRGYRGPDERERDERAMTRSRRAPIMAHAPAARSCCVLLRPAPPSAASHCGMLMCRRSVISPAVPQSFAKVQTPK